MDYREVKVPRVHERELDAGAVVAGLSPGRALSFRCPNRRLAEQALMAILAAAKTAGADVRWWQQGAAIKVWLNPLAAAVDDPWLSVLAAHVENVSYEVLSRDLARLAPIATAAASVGNTRKRIARCMRSLGWFPTQIGAARLAGWRKF